MAGTISGQDCHRRRCFTAEVLRRNKTRRNGQWESTEAVQGQSTTNNLTFIARKKNTTRKSARAREQISATRRKKSQQAQVIESAQQTKKYCAKAKGIEAKDSARSKSPVCRKKDRQSDNATIWEMTVVEIRRQLAATVEIATTGTQK